MAATRVAAPLLPRALARGIAPAYYLHGSAALLKDDALAAILDVALDPTLRDFNLDLLSARQLDPDQLGAALAVLPMMAERRVVVVREIEQWRRKSKAKQSAVTALQRAGADVVAVLIQGDDGDPDPDLAPHTVAVDCDSPVGEALEAWLVTRLERADVTLTPAAQEHLLRATSGDAGLLAAEIAKLSGIESTGPIDADLVGDLVGVRHGETADDWRDLVLRDRLPEAVALTPSLLALSGQSGVKLVTTLGSSLLVLRWARATARARQVRGGALASAVRQLCFSTRPAVGSYPPFADLVAEVVGAWPDQRLRGAIEATLQADIALKSTTVSDESGIVTDLLIALAAGRPVVAA